MEIPASAVPKLWIFLPGCSSAKSYSAPGLTVGVQRRETISVYLRKSQHHVSAVAGESCSQLHFGKWTVDGWLEHCRISRWFQAGGRRLIVLSASLWSYPGRHGLVCPSLYWIFALHWSVQIGSSAVIIYNRSIEFLSKKKQKSLCNPCGCSICTCRDQIDTSVQVVWYNQGIHVSNVLQLRIRHLAERSVKCL